MDAVGRQRLRAHQKSELSTSNTTLPALVVIVIGLLVTITGIVLFAAFKLDDVTRNPRQVSGPVVTALGGVIVVMGIVYAVILRKREEQRRQQAQLEAQQRANYGNHGNGTHQASSYANQGYTGGGNHGYEQQHPQHHQQQQYR